MRSLHRLVRVGAVAAAVSLAGCAPSLGPGLALGLDPTGTPTLGLSSCFLGGPAYNVPYGASRSAFGAFSFAPKIAQLQSRYSYSRSDVRVQRASWQRLASGEC